MERVNSILEFKKTALERGVCDKFSDKLREAKDARDLVTLLLTIQGAEYLFSAINEGWADNKELAISLLTPFANGKFILFKDGYSSEMNISLSHQDVEICTVLCLFMYCDNIRIIVPQGCAVRIMCIKCKNMLIENHSIAYVYNYDKDEPIKASPSFNPINNIIV